MKTPADTSSRGLWEAFEDNFSSFMTHVTSKWPGCLRQEDEHGTFYLSGVPCSFLNGVYNARLSEKNALDYIREVKRRCAERKVPMMWVVGPRTTPSNIGDTLASEGFVLDPSSTLFVDLLETDLSAFHVPGLTVAEVMSRQGLMDFRSGLKGHGLDDVTLNAYTELLEYAGYGPGRMLRHFVGYVGGIPVAASSAILGDGVVGVYNVATLPEYRRRGIAGALTAYACFAGKQEGYRYCGLTTTEMSHRLYSSMGFKFVGRWDVFDWQPAVF